MKYLIKLNDLAATVKLANLIAVSIVPNFVLTLSGDLGAGKTTIVREILYQLGVTGSVKSPTYTIVEPYQIANIDLYHFDLYRFNDPEEWFDAGFDEYFVNNSICFIEWAENAAEFIPVVDWELKIKVTGEIRHIEISAGSDKGRECLQKLIQNAAQ